MTTIYVAMNQVLITAKWINKTQSYSLLFFFTQNLCLWQTKAKTKISNKEKERRKERKREAQDISLRI